MWCIRTACWSIIGRRARKVSGRDFSRYRIPSERRTAAGIDARPNWQERAERETLTGPAMALKRTRPSTESAALLQGLGVALARRRDGERGGVRNRLAVCQFGRRFCPSRGNPESWGGLDRAYGFRSWPPSTLGPPTRQPTRLSSLPRRLRGPQQQDRALQLAAGLPAPSTDTPYAVRHS